MGRGAYHRIGRRGYGGCPHRDRLPRLCGYRGGVIETRVAALQTRLALLPSLVQWIGWRRATPFSGGAPRRRFLMPHSSSSFCPVSPTNTPPLYTACAV